MTASESNSNRVIYGAPKNDGFARRLESVLAGESVRSFAERSGIPDASLRRYLSGHEPKLGALVAIARAGSVSVDWLATGEGPMERPGEVGGISSALCEYVTRVLGPNADEEEIEMVMQHMAARALKPSAHAASEPPALSTPAPIETTQQSLEVVEEAMGVVGYDPGSRAMTRLMGMLLDQDIKPEALPRILEILRDHESTRNGST